MLSASDSLPKLSPVSCKTYSSNTDSMSSFQKYLDYMSAEKVYADAIVIQAAASKYKRIIHIYNSPDTLPVVHLPQFEDDADLDTSILSESSLSVISLAYVNGNFGYSIGAEEVSTLISNHFVSLVKRTSNSK